jgi:aspartyl-tRNA synthetase
MHAYRTHTCNDLGKEQIGQTVKLSGWVHNRRDHGGVLFIDLRDHYGITQLVFPSGGAVTPDDVNKIRYESVITVEGEVLARDAEAVNNKMDTGAIEVTVSSIIVESAVEVEQLPVEVRSDKEFPENTRLSHRFLDLRREKLHNNIVLRSKIISWLRARMTSEGFMEFQTPILTASSPEGARDYLVPSRVHPGQFYALPQAPQQFKQLLMVSGFDKYFQVAPCFRDEDARADRSPGEFYQLDIEMSFVEQEDVFKLTEGVIGDLFREFSSKQIDDGAFARIPFDESMLKYGNDKPDLRNPLIISDVTENFRGSGFGLFAGQIEKGATVRAIPAPGTAEKPRSFFDKKNAWAQSEGFAGLGYIVFNADGTAKGPIAKQLNDEELAALKVATGVTDGDALFFSCNVNHLQAADLAGKARTKVAEDLELIDENVFKFCWVVDFPYFEWDEDNNKIEFSHNPFSMPQGGLAALDSAVGDKQKLLALKAFQYDVVCNGVELSSGAIRNHLPELMYKAFEIAGYDNSVVDEKFGGMIKAFKFGAPPHGGIAPGVDRMVMLIADEPNIREVIAFPMNQQAQDLLMNAPAPIDHAQLRELNLQLSVKAKEALETREATDGGDTEAAA